MTRAANLAEAAGSGFAGRNRIINGAMMIDQRNAGASVTPASGPAQQYMLDRWAYAYSQNSKLSMQQSSTAPAGFVNSFLFTSLSAYSVGVGDYFVLIQPIEGLNLTDLAWGTASAQPVTLSFWVRSSLAGTFGGSVRNNATSRSYPFSYTISSANTWEQKTVTIPGDTSGTWLTTNAIGLSLVFGLGNGSTFSGPANTWANANYHNVTGATSVVGTSGATFYITGVQLEKGSTATPFENRLYGTELALCQRYYQKVGDGSGNVFMLAQFPSTTEADGLYQNIVPMRASPSLVQTTGSAYYLLGAPANKNWSSFSGVTQSVNSTIIWTNALTGLTAGQAGQMYGGNAASSIALSAEL